MGRERVLLKEGPSPSPNPTYSPRTSLRRVSFGVHKRFRPAMCFAVRGLFCPNETRLREVFLSGWGIYCIVPALLIDLLFLREKAGMFKYT